MRCVWPWLGITLFGALSAGCGSRVSLAAAKDDTAVLGSDELDLNGDGFADLLAAKDPFTSLFEVFLGSPSGLVWADSLSLPVGGTHPIGTTLGDTRGQGITDVAFVPYQQGAASGCVERLLVIEGGDPWSVDDRDMWSCGLNALGDVDGDGRDDVMVRVDDFDTEPLHELLYGGAQPAIALANCDGLLQPVGDVDGAKGDEVLCVQANDSGETYDLTLAAVSATGELVEIAVRQVSRASNASVVDRFAGAGDVDGDGWSDVLQLPAHASADITVFLLRGSPQGLSAPEPFATLHVGTAPLSAPTPLGDVNGDGVLDFSIAAYGEPPPPFRSYAAISQANGWTMQGIPNDGYLPLPIGDVNGDGLIDVASRYSIGTADHDGLQILHGSEEGLIPGGDLIISQHINGLDYVSVATPAFRRRYAP
jgi:FG-GAP-like repeat